MRTTLLAAHALPPEYAGRADDYIGHVVEHIVPEAARLRLADAVDAFCETIGFDLLQTRRVFQAAREHGLPVKLHAEQLSNMHGAALAAEFGALSADHLEHVDEAGVDGDGAVRHRRGDAARRLTTSCATPTCRRSTCSAATACRWRWRPTATPGSSPTTHLPLMMNMACTLFRMTPAEAMLGVTRHAARGARACSTRTAPSSSARSPTCACGTSTTRPNWPTRSVRFSPLRARLHGGRHHPLQ